MQPFYTSVVPLGNNIFLRWIEDGQRHMKKIEYQPSIYVPSKTGKGTKESLHGTTLEEIKMDSMKDCRDFVKRYKDIDGYKMYGTTDFDASFIAEYFPYELKFDKNLIRVANIDIEVFTGSIDSNGEVVEGPFPDPKDALYPVNAICLHDSFTDIYHVFGLEKFMGVNLGTYVHDKADKHVGKLKVQYTGYQTEERLLQAFLTKWQECKFDVYTGYNTTTFDTPYLTNRIKKVLGDGTEKLLSPWKIVNMRTFQNMYGDQLACEWYGIEELDWLDLYKKFSFESPISHKLGYISTYELGETKLSYEEEGTLNKLYVLDYQRFITYNIKDVDLVRRLDEKRNFIELAMSIAYITKSNYRDALATVKPWTNLIYDMLYKKNVIPDIHRVYQGEIDFMGGYVKEPVAGFYKWVVSFDLNSLDIYGPCSSDVACKLL